LFKVKEGEDFNRPARHPKRDRHPYIEVFRGLKSEPDLSAVPACPLEWQIGLA